MDRQQAWMPIEKHDRFAPVMKTIKKDVTFAEVLSCFERENGSSLSFEYAKDLLTKANNENGNSWTLVILSRVDILNITLPWHKDPNPFEIVPKEGMVVSAAGGRIRKLTGERGPCWANICSHKDRDFSQTHIFLKVRNGGLEGLDGLHRLLAWVVFEKKEEIAAYVSGLTPESVVMSDWFDQAVTGGIEAGWISREGIKRRLNALRTAHSKMDRESQESLPSMVIFAPSFGAGGQTMRREIPPKSAFVYLSPSLEYEWQVNVDFIVAHELAHVVLGHGKQRQRRPEEAGLPHELTADEIAASELVAKWNIPKWKPSESRFLNLLERILAPEPDDKGLKKQEDGANEADGLPPGDQSFDTRG